MRLLLRTGFQYPALAVAPRGHRRDDEPKLKASPRWETLMAMPSSTGWRPISDIPADRKDGRRMLLWEEDQCVIGRWDPMRGDWEEPESMITFEEISFWADLLEPQ